MKRTSTTTTTKLGLPTGQALASLIRHTSKQVGRYLLRDGWFPSFVGSLLSPDMLAAEIGCGLG